MRTVLLVYHKPGTSEGRLLVELLAATVEVLTGIPTETMEVGLLAGNQVPRDGAVDAFILLTARGGHYADAYTALKRSGARVYGPIPPWLSALHLVRELPDCTGPVVIEYHPAKRLSRERAEDYETIARLASKLLGMTVRAAPAGSGGQGCRVSLSLTPSRAAARAAMNLPLLPAGRDLLASWIASTLQYPYNGG